VKTAERRLKLAGWGFEGEGLTPTEAEALARMLRAAFPDARLHRREPPGPPQLDAPRLDAPAALAPLFTSDPHERALHALGKGYPDLVRAFRGEFPHAPELVALPADEADVVRVLDWAAEERVAIVPFGGGSSVVGGVEPDVGDGFRGAVSLDLRRLAGVLEVDDVSRAARVQAGTRGPVLEEQLRAHGLTFRHYPQSFEHSTVGGWIATRSGGHFATGRTHVDDFVESLRVVTPRGVLETRRLPASGAGPDPNRLFCGSEGTLGVIVEAWLRVQEPPERRAGAAVAFPSFLEGAEAVRRVLQSGLRPAGCRLLDPVEALTSGSGDGSSAILVLAFEASGFDPEPQLRDALELGGGEPARRETAGRWREAFLRMPYVYEEIVALGLLTGTFETAVTWDRFPDFHDAVSRALVDAATDACGAALVSCRLAYAYPDGPAPYYTLVAPTREGAELEQWTAVKRAAADAVLACGGTITHHHAVGREHRPWYQQEVPPLVLEALRAAKRELDPAGVLNPGALLR
jgi:alkyldihydroxyacetonephosphate synthase